MKAENTEKKENGNYYQEKDGKNRKRNFTLLFVKMINEAEKSNMLRR